MLTQKAEVLRAFFAEPGIARARAAYPGLETACSVTEGFLGYCGEGSLIPAMDPETISGVEAALEEIQGSLRGYIADRDNVQCTRASAAVLRCYELVYSDLGRIKALTVQQIGDAATKAQVLLDGLDGLKTSAVAKVGSVEHARNTAVSISNKLQETLDEAVGRVNQFAVDEIKKTEEGIDGLRKRHESVFDDYKRDWEKHSATLKNTRDEFAEIVAAAKKYYKDTRFEEYSKREQRQADGFRKIGIALMIAVALAVLALTAAAVVGYVPTDSLGAIASRYLLVFSLMIPAIYVTREASRHRRNADRYAQMACELTAFDLALKDPDMPQSLRNEIKADLLRRYFGAVASYKDKDMLDVLKVKTNREE